MYKGTLREPSENIILTVCIPVGKIKVRGAKPFQVMVECFQSGHINPVNVPLGVRYYRGNVMMILSEFMNENKTRSA